MSTLQINDKFQDLYKNLKLIVKMIWLKKMHLVAYLNNILIIAKSKKEVLKKTKWLINQLQLHSFTKLKCIAPIGQSTMVPDLSYSAETNMRENLIWEKATITLLVLYWKLAPWFLLLINLLIVPLIIENFSWTIIIQFVNWLWTLKFK